MLTQDIQSLSTIERWRRAQALRRTLTRRPDLLTQPVDPAVQALLDEFPD